MLWTLGRDVLPRNMTVEAGFNIEDDFAHSPLSC